MFEEKPVGWGRRVTRATMLALLGVILYIVIPSILLDYLSSVAPGVPVPITTGLIYGFGGTITALQVLGALTEGMMVSIPFESGSYIATAAYIYLAVNGGTFAIAVSGFNFLLSFKPLLFLLVLPPMYGAVRAPLSYLLDIHEAARPSPNTV